MDEDEKIINNYPNYSISKKGLVKNINTGKFLSLKKKSDGYISVKLTNENGRKGYRVNRLVACAFIPNPENKPTVNHKNHNRCDNNVDNLEWATSAEQNIHKRKPNKINQRKALGVCVLRIDKDTNETIEEYDSLTSASEWCIENKLTENKGAIGQISMVCKGKGITAFGFKWVYKKNSDNCDVDEEWRPILPIHVDGTEGYFMSNYGRLKNKHGHIRNGWDNNEYVQVSIGKRKSYLLHIIIALTFIENSDPENKKEVNHIDGDKKNNKVTNLEWVTHSENVQHAFDTGLTPTKPVVQYDVNGNKIASFNSAAEASRQLKLSAGPSNILRVLDSDNLACGFIWRSKEEHSNINNNITYTNSTKHHKKVMQYDLNMKFIREFNSAQEVSETFGVNAHTVNDCCAGRQKTCCNFIFRYKGEENVVVDMSNKNNKSVVQYNVNMEIIKIFPSVTAAETELKIKNISSVARGVRKQAGGFIFKYYE